MTEEKRRKVKEWFRKALSDLTIAEKGAAEPNPVYDGALYHCQQAMEKSVKGFLLFKDSDFEKTHDLETLILQAADHDESFLAWKDAGIDMTPYAYIYRYPNDLEQDEPTREDFETAFKLASDFYQFVLNKLPQEARP